MIISTQIPYRNKLISYNDLKPNSKIPIIIECDLCHKQFNSTKSQITKNNHQMCQQCALLIKNGKPIQIGEVFNKLTVIKQGKSLRYSICKCECGNTCEVLNTHLRTGQVKSCGCSRSIHAKQMMIELNQTKKSENHPRWKGGISNKRDRIEKTKTYKIIRQMVFIKNKFKCQKCNSSKNLNTHHIIPYVDNPDLLTDINNIEQGKK